MSGCARISPGSLPKVRGHSSLQIFFRIKILNRNDSETVEHSTHRNRVSRGIIPPPGTMLPAEWHLPNRTRPHGDPRRPGLHRPGPSVRDHEGLDNFFPNFSGTTGRPKLSHPEVVGELLSGPNLRDCFLVNIPVKFSGLRHCQRFVANPSCVPKIPTGGGFFSPVQYFYVFFQWFSLLDPRFMSYFFFDQL